MKNLNNTKDSLSKNAFIFTLGNFFIKSISVLTAPIFTRLLSTDDFGLVSIYAAWMSIFSIFTCFELKGTINVAYIEFGEKNYKAYIKNCVCLCLLFTTSLLLLSALFPGIIHGVTGLNQTYIYAAIIHSLFNGVILFLSNYLVIRNNAWYYIALSLLQLLLNITISIGLIVDTNLVPHAGRIYGQFLACVIIGVPIVHYFMKEHSQYLNKSYSRYAISLGIPLIFHALSGILLTTCDKIMLSHYINNSIAGIYSFAVTVVSLINTVWYSFNTAWKPFYFEHLKDEHYNYLKKRMNSYLLSFTVIIGIFMLVVPEMVKILSDKSYWTCTPFVILLCIGYYFNFLYSLPANHAFYYKKNHWIAVGSMFTALINVGLNYILIPIWGPIGAASATSAAYILEFLIHDRITRKKTEHYCLNFKCYVPYIVLFFVLVFISYQCIEHIFIRWFIALILSIIILIKIKKTRYLI